MYMIVSNRQVKPDWKLIRDHLHKEGRIAKPELFKLIQEMNKILSMVLIVIVL